MKRTLIFLLALQLAFSCRTTCFAAGSNLAQKSKDVFAQYIGGDGETETDVSGEKEITLEPSDGTQITVSNIPEGAVKLIVYSVPADTETEAWAWITNCLQGKGTPAYTFDIYFMDADGRRINADGTVVTVICPSDLQNPIVCSLDTNGAVTELETVVGDQTRARGLMLTFTTNGSNYYIVAEKTTSSENDNKKDDVNQDDNDQKNEDKDDKVTTDSKNPVSAGTNVKEETGAQNAATGDESSVGLWITFAGISIAGIAGLIFYKKRRTESK